MSILSVKPLFNPQGDTDKNSRRMIGGNTTNLNDFNNMKYTWASSWYRQAMNNFWIPEEINLSQDIKDLSLIHIFSNVSFLYSYHRNKFNNLFYYTGILNS